MGRERKNGIILIPNNPFAIKPTLPLMGQIVLFFIYIMLISTIAIYTQNTILLLYRDNWLLLYVIPIISTITFSLSLSLYPATFTFSLLSLYTIHTPFPLLYRTILLVSSLCHPPLLYAHSISLITYLLSLIYEESTCLRLSPQYPYFLFLLIYVHLLSYMHNHFLSSYMSFPAISVYLLWIYIAIPK